MFDLHRFLDSFFELMIAQHAGEPFDPSLKELSKTIHNLASLHDLKVRIIQDVIGIHFNILDRANVLQAQISVRKKENATMDIW